jgi:hypothetical protein
VVEPGEGDGEEEVLPVVEPDEHAVATSSDTSARATFILPSARASVVPVFGTAE